jgi:hypothetical protein
LAAGVGQTLELFLNVGPCVKSGFDMRHDQQRQSGYQTQANNDQRQLCLDGQSGKEIHDTYLFRGIGRGSAEPVLG